MKQNNLKYFRFYLFPQLVTCCNQSLNIPSHQIVSENQESNYTARTYDASNTFMILLQNYQ